MPVETGSRSELTRNFPAAWPGNTRGRPYSKGGWITLESRDTATNPEYGAARLTKPWDDRVVLKGDVCKSVFWRAEGAKNDEVTEGILCIRKLRSDEPAPVENVFVDPSRRDSFFVRISNVGGFSKARIGPTTTFVTDQGRFVVSLEQRTVRPPLLEPSIAALYTSTTYMATFEGGSMQCMRDREYLPPPADSVDAAQIEQQFRQSLKDLPQTLQYRLDKMFRSQTKAFVSGGLLTQHPEKMKTKKNTSVTFSTETPVSREAQRLDEWDDELDGSNEMDVSPSTAV